MAKRDPRTPREKYGEELRIRRTAAGMTQEALGERVVCSPTLISHFEAGRRLPTPDDAHRIDQVLGTDGWFARWRRNLESKYPERFVQTAELMEQASHIRFYAAHLVPGALQTRAYAHALFAAYRPNHTPEELDRLVVNRLERSRLLNDPCSPVVWVLLDEAVLRRQVGGPVAMAEQVRHLEGMTRTGRLRLHVLPFGAGAHALMEGLISLMQFTDMAPVAYTESVLTGRLIDDQAEVAHSQCLYELALSDALPQQESLALLRAVAEEYERED